MIDLLIGSGITAIIMYGKPTQFIRMGLSKVGLSSLTSCALCTGFWVGVFLTIVKNQQILYPFAVACAAWAIDAFVNGLREYYIK